MSFDRIARIVTDAAGSAWLFSIVALSLAAWWAFGFVTGFPDTWYQLMSAALHTLVFLMTLIIQHSANKRDARMLTEIDAIYHRHQKQGGQVHVEGQDL